jgi:hypothetical protein
LTDNTVVRVTGLVNIWNQSTNSTRQVPITLNANTLLDSVSADLTVTECFIGMVALYILFMGLAFLGLKINSRKI